MYPNMNFISTPPSKPVRPHIELPKIPMGFSGREAAVSCVHHFGPVAQNDALEA